MKKTRHTTDQIIEKLRQADVALGNLERDSVAVERRIDAVNKRVLVVFWRGHRRIQELGF